MHHPSPYIWNVAFCFSGGVFFGRRQFSTLVAKFLATMESGIFFVHQVDLGMHGSQICWPSNFSLSIGPSEPDQYLS